MSRQRLTTNNDLLLTILVFGALTAAILILLGTSLVHIAEIVTLAVS